MTVRRILCITGVLVFVFPALTFADTKIVITGLSVRFDYDNPQYESAATDSLTGNSSGTNEKDKESSAALGLRPVVKFLSESKEGTFELRTAPGIKHDFVDSELDWEVDVFLSAAQSLSKNWRLTTTNTLLRRDEYDPHNSAAVDSGAQDIESESSIPALAVDRGRSRYWLNTFNFASEHPYREDSQLRLGFNNRILRNDVSVVRSYEDYNRTEIAMKQRHRFSSAWQAGVDFGVVRGAFDTTEMATSEEGNTTATEPTQEDALSEDVREYRARTLVGNNTFRHHDVSLGYSYIGARYDEALHDDGDIHEVQLLWRHEYSRHVQTKLGAGPSYEKTEGQDVNWSGNGIAEWKYLLRSGSFSLTLEKGYDVDNFSGTGERGFVDFWNLRSGLEYRLLEDLSSNGHLAYRYEDRQNPSAGDDSQAVAAGVDDDALEEDYYKKRYTTGAGLRYSFLKDYSTSLNYTFIKQDSERIDEDYEDHRLVLSLSWEKEWLRW